MGIGSTAILSSAVLFWVVFFFSPSVNLITAQIAFQNNAFRDQKHFPRLVVNVSPIVMWGSPILFLFLWS